MPSNIFAVLAIWGFASSAYAFQSFECFFSDGSKLGTIRIDGNNSYKVNDGDFERCSIMPGGSNPVLMVCAKESKPNGRDTVVEIASLQMLLLDTSSKTIKVGVYMPETNYFAMSFSGSCQ